MWTKYSKLNKLVVGLCLAKHCGNFVYAKNPYCEIDSCSKCLPDKSILGLFVVASRLGGCPPSPKDVWKIIFDIYSRTYYWFRGYAHYNIPSEMMYAIYYEDPRVPWDVTRCPKDIVSVQDDVD